MTPILDPLQAGIVGHWVILNLLESVPHVGIISWQTSLPATPSGMPIHVWATTKQTCYCTLLGATPTVKWWEPRNLCSHVIFAVLPFTIALGNFLFTWSERMPLTPEDDWADLGATTSFMGFADLLTFPLCWTSLQHLERWPEEGVLLIPFTKAVWFSTTEKLKKESSFSWLPQLPRNTVIHLGFRPNTSVASVRWMGLLGVYLFRGSQRLPSIMEAKWVGMM